MKEPSAHTAIGRGNGHTARRSDRTPDSAGRHPTLTVPLTDAARVVLEKRYLRTAPGEDHLESAEDLFWRVACNVAAVDRAYDPSADVAATAEAFYSLLATLTFLPNSPTLMNAGRDLQQLAACFVLPVEDSMESIFETLKQTALIHKSGGGTGFSFSRLRPRDDRVRTTNGVSSGPVSFMKVFNDTTEVVKQGGTRRGANMAVLRVDHPDIIEFITSKDREGAIANFNISVGLTDDFLRRAAADEEYDLINPRNGAVVQRLRARRIADLIVNMAWRNGEPGVVFLDAMNRANPTPDLGAIEATNPCGEQPLLPHEACTLGSVNLALMVRRSARGPAVDYPALRRAVRRGVHFLDNVVDANQYPLEAIRDRTLTNRKIGLGVMGWADLLIALGIRYDTEAALALAGRVMRTVQEESKAASAALAERRGAFPHFERSVLNRPGAPRLRNACTTTVAPTGTLSLIAGCSSGIEPLFAAVYRRMHVLDDETLHLVHPAFEHLAREGGWYSPALLERAAQEGSIQGIAEIPAAVRRVFVVSHDIAPEWHVRMQAAFQRHCDSGVSKTVNFPQTATPDDVRTVFALAHDLGCKGVTVYRDGSRRRQVLRLGATPPADASEAARIEPRRRPGVTTGTTERITTGEGNLYITINRDEAGLCEVFANIGKHGTDVSAWSEAVGRLISLCLRSGISIKALTDELIGITSRPIWQDGEQILSVPDAIGRALLRQLDQVGTAEGAGPNSGGVTAPSGMACPDCGAPVEPDAGCVICRQCGYSRCG